MGWEMRESNTGSKRTFVNFTNHPSANWSEKQRAAAEKYGSVVDVSFPQVDPALTEEDVKQMAGDCVDRILDENPAIVQCQGEFTLCYSVVTELKKRGIPVVAACSRRLVEEVGGKGEDTKVVRFVFEGFRSY